MAKHLTDEDIANIVGILDDWPMDSRLTWNKLVEACAHSLNIETTRQTLSKYSRIRTAFSEVKVIASPVHKRNAQAENRVPPSLKIAQERLEKKDREIARLKRENEQLLIQFHTWLYNAQISNVSIEQLNKPLPKVSD